jgi:hypothetical protein
VSKPQEVTFYATTSVQTTSVGVGWTGAGISGIVGQIQITSAQFTPGNARVSDIGTEPYLWSFTLQSDTDQAIQGVQYVTSATLYPPGQVQFVSKKQSAPVYGVFQVSQNQVQLTFFVPPHRGQVRGGSLKTSLCLVFLLW